MKALARDSMEIITYLVSFEQLTCDLHCPRYSGKWAIIIRVDTEDEPHVSTLVMWKTRTLVACLCDASEGCA